GSVLPLNQGIHYAVITEKDGSFRLYTPLSDHLKEQRGKYIPPKSKFLLHIEMANSEEYRSYKGWHYNDKENVIQLEKKDITEFVEDYKFSEDGSYHTFIFKDENGRELSLEQQKKIELNIHQHNKPTMKLDYQDWQDGGIFPKGIYKASFSKNRGLRTAVKTTYNFKPVEVNATHPKEVVFQLSDSITYVGHVVDGVTGLPMEGAFVIAMWGPSDNRNLSWLTQQEWDALHKLDHNPDVSDPNVWPIHKKYMFKTIQRTGSDGKFSIKALPEDKIYGCVVFEENYVPVKEIIYKPKKMEKLPDVYDFGTINLFPAGKIKFEIVVPEKHVAVIPKWKIDSNKSPSWSKKIKNAESRWIEENAPDSIYVPAGVTFQLSFRMPYDKQWEALTIDRVFKLDKGESVDIGKQHLQGSISIFVKVVDPEDNPVEGVPVRLGQHVAHITDIEGRVKFHVPMYSGGRVGINYHSHDSEKNLRKQIIYAVKGKDDTNKEFMIKLTEQEIKLTEQELSILFD
ncbi:MAG: hypothetical protein ACYSPI_05080, partial [Planctomycetota bacterium]